jgi:ArsR family metal-binding transcriptional regulator
MLKKLKDNFEKGVERVKWFAGFFSERLKIEIALIKLLYRSDELNKQKDELLISIGQRVCELKRSGEKNMQKDAEILKAVDEIERLEKNAGDIRQKVSEITRVSV